MIGLIAWVGMLVESNLSQIVWRVVLRTDVPPWDPFARTGVLLILLVLTLTWSPARPVSGFLLALIALLLGLWSKDRLVGTALWQQWVQRAPVHEQLLAQTMAATVLPAVLMTLTLVGSGIGPRQLFLVKGAVAARTTLPWLGQTPWTVVAPIVAVLFVLPLALVLTFTARPDFRVFNRALAALPLAALFALVNASGEEFRFRSVLLARLIPTVGVTQAIWLTSVLFGLGHWWGHPSGPLGVLMTGFAGLILARSMLDTGGFTWALFMHGIQDVVIYSFVVMAGR